MYRFLLLFSKPQSFLTRLKFSIYICDVGKSRSSHVFEMAMISALKCLMYLLKTSRFRLSEFIFMRKYEVISGLLMCVNMNSNIRDILASLSKLLNRDISSETVAAHEFCCGTENTLTGIVIAALLAILERSPPNLLLPADVVAAMSACSKMKKAVSGGRMAHHWQYVDRSRPHHES